MVKSSARMLHGLFDSVAVTEQILNWLKPDCKLDSYVDLDSHREQQLNKLADVCRDYLAIDKISDIIKNEH